MARVLHVCMPTRGAIALPTHLFLRSYNEWAGKAGFKTVCQYNPTGMGVIEGREQCLTWVDEAMRETPGNEDWILWLDDDMDPPFNALMNLINVVLVSEKTAHPIGLISGFYCRKVDYDLGMAFSPKTNYPLLPLVDYEPGEVVEVGHCGLGFALQRATWNEKLAKPRFKGNAEGAAEDFHYMQALREVGCIPYVHTGVRIGHFEINTQKTFRAYITPPPVRHSNGTPVKVAT